MSITKEEALAEDARITEAKELKLIYDYMEWPYYEPDCDCGICSFCNGLKKNKTLDPNSAWECKQKIEDNEDWDEFSIFYMNEFELLSLSDMPHFMIWSANPKNFFTCFRKWLKDKQNRYSDGTKIFPNR